MYDENVWNNRDRKMQPVNFTGFDLGKIYPCDLDGCLDWKNMGFILYEAKYKNAPMPFGQQLMYTRLADALDNGGKPTLFMVCEHDVTDPMKDINLAECKVRLHYFQGQLDETYHGKVKDLTMRFVNFLEEKRQAKWQTRECSQ